MNVYNNSENTDFELISNLFAVETIEQCYDQSITGNIPGIKDDNGNRSVYGHPGRIVHVGQKELELFAKLFDGSEDWKQAKLPILHAQALIDVLFCFANQNKTLANISENVYCAEMWHETNNQVDGTIKRDVHFPDTVRGQILSGPHIGVSNPFFKTSRKECKLNSDYDSIDLTQIPQDYLSRCNYSIACSIDEYEKREPDTTWGSHYSSEYRLCFRKMLNQSGERTLISTIIPPSSEHINGIFGMAFKNDLFPFAATSFSIPFDFYLKATGKANINFSAASGYPVINDNPFGKLITVRGLLLNCLTKPYSPLWNEYYDSIYTDESWSKSDPRLDNKRFSTLTSEWTWDTPLRTDYERRQALVEIDVLTAMALGMTLEQLKTIYHIQFPVLQQYEADTWYDANGRIVFTTNRSLVGVGFDRKEWEGNVKGAPAGRVFTREIEDDTMPGGIVRRTIEYVAPFDKCDREQDYETAWRFFEEKYGK